jgi:hypothetical protein
MDMLYVSDGWLLNKETIGDAQIRILPVLRVRFGSK